MRAITAISHLSLCFALTHGNPQGSLRQLGVGTSVRGGWSGPLQNLRNRPGAKPLAPAPSPRMTPPRVPADERAALAFQFDDPLLIDEPSQQQLQQKQRLQRSFSSSTGFQAVSLVCVAVLVRLALSSSGELGPWRTFLQAYNALNTARPLLTQALLTGFTYVLSDVTAQVRI